MRAAPLALLAFLGLSGCGPAEGTATSVASPAPGPSATTGPSGKTEDAAAPSVTSLAGAWRVAGIDGLDFNEGYALALGGSEDELWWEPRCAGQVRSYRISGTEISFGPSKAERARRPGEATSPVCAIGLPLRLGEVMRALDSAAAIERTPHNGALIRGGGHSVLLFSR